MAAAPLRVWPQEPAAAASPGGVSFTSPLLEAGLAGVTSPGAWTPLLVELQNAGDADLDLTLVWSLPDAAGDTAEMVRRLPVPAGRSAAAWLYGVPRPGPPPADGWPVVALDAGGAVVAAAAARADPTRRLDTGEELILQLSGSDLGLGDYQRQAASHAKRRLLRGLRLDELPDRAQGLQAVGAIVWAADGGGDPTAAGVPAAALGAWIRGGGHLVVVLPAVGERWTQSPLAALLPLPAGTAPRRGEVELPTLGVVRPADADAAQAWILPDRDAEVLLRAASGEALVTSARRGFGKVTLVGLDLTAAAYRDAGLPSGTTRFWNDVFGWSDPAVSERREAVLRGQVAATPPQIQPARNLPAVEVGGFIERSLGLRGSVSTALTVLLGVLVLLPVALGALSLRGRTAGRGEAAAVLASPRRWAWPLFALACVGAAGLAAAVAFAGRPTGPSAIHQSVVDLDPAAGARRTRSWVSLFVPGFGRAAVELRGEGEAGATLLSTAGVRSGGGGFLDPQAYRVDAADPRAAELPLRSTTRPLRLDHAERDLPAAGSNRARLIGTAEHAPGTPRLRATLESSLAADLKDVLIVYCPGEGFAGSTQKPLPPRAWRYEPAGGGTVGVWPAGATLEVDGVPPRAVPLSVAAPLGEAGAGFNASGWLNAVLDQGGLAAAADRGLEPSLADPVRAGEALSFFGRLPPPDVNTVVPPFAARLQRALPGLVGLDLSHLTGGPRLIVLGHAEGDPLPVPLRVDGQVPPSSGRTLYRVIVDLEPAGS
ncbi:hypothetical protein PSMK_17780 [Phycisphaera mikurensis NBRC 102666]|uniref:Uncharacterized protein n=1 Tax=Phycisphaera mikurensis (strain NBRC 102666 / KCTC 22515 / FYK2301M01) TaxID=1142394 RepID=I0IF99_PHYMF|nr:hypothetical protein PSMK_17780 [Phycisphaera mikurensis NBRC 102666]